MLANSCWMGRERENEGARAGLAPSSFFLNFVFCIDMVTHLNETRIKTNICRVSIKDLLDDLFVKPNNRPSVVECPAPGIEKC